MNRLEAKVLLRQEVWQEGKIIPIAEGPYRHRIVVHCSASGRQKAIFANGEYPYFGYIEILSNKGERIEQGAGIVPILPDGRLIMVVEQRPPQGRYSDRPMVAVVGGEEVNLADFGMHSSLEFPGGAIDQNEGIKSGFLRELVEETGISNQTALCYTSCHPIYPLGSDVAVRGFVSVVFLSGFHYEKRVNTDGGLVVLALTKEEVRLNIWRGVIHSGQAAIIQWNFYREVEPARSNPQFEKELVRRGYLSIETIKIAR